MLKALGYSLQTVATIYICTLSKDTYPFALASYILVGIFSLIKFFSSLSAEGSSFNTLDCELSQACYFLCIPLISTEICILQGIKYEYALINLILPVMEFVVSISGGDYRDRSVDLSRLCSLAAIAYCTITMERYIGMLIIVGTMFITLAEKNENRFLVIFAPLIGILVILSTHSFLTNIPIQDCLKQK
ncbi:hypothetical protein O3M35_005157 [Rhynocoris fuscipes]|uniref:Dolichol kinase n=1 Tax=Rhynocoris fuscipes TaxID=488301 RepID=A0AAW1DJF6_9HEMI